MMAFIFFGFCGMISTAVINSLDMFKISQDIILITSMEESEKSYKMCYNYAG